jgi:hypothetical protein
LLRRYPSAPLLAAAAPATPGKLDAYFGVVPIEVGSGAERDGTQRYAMSRRGHDLVRRYLWLAALSAVRHNPAVRALCARLARRRPKRKAAALGQCMGKLLHLAFAVCKSGKPFDPQHDPWDTPAHVEGAETPAEGQAGVDEESSDNVLSPEDRAAGLRPEVPAEKEVTAAQSLTSTTSIPKTLAGRRTHCCGFWPSEAATAAGPGARPSRPEVTR